MAYTIDSAKEAGVSAQPVFLFDFTWPDGSVLSVCSHALTWGGVSYLPRVTAQQIDPIQALSPQGIDIPPNVKVTLADANKDFWAIEADKKFRGARLRVTFVYYDFALAEFSTDSLVPFVGRCGRPEVTDDSLIVTAGYLLNLEAKMLPSFPIQRRCPKLFPSTPAMKALADVVGSPYYPCGVSDPTKLSCTFDVPGCALNNNSPRFGGVDYEVPPASKSHEYITGNWLTDLQSDPNLAKYGDHAPIGYGAAWVDCLLMGTWPDANSTRGEAIVCEGRPDAIVKVVVNDEELPAATDLDGNPFHVADPLFRYNVISSGDRDGKWNQDTPWNGKGDPSGSQCKIEWVVYHKLTATAPRVRALIRFPQVQTYAKIASITGGVATLANGVPNEYIAGNAPYTIRIFGNANPALNGVFGLSDWHWGPPGTVTLAGTSASGAGGYIAYLSGSEKYAWAILDVLLRSALTAADVDMDSFVAADQFHRRVVSYGTFMSPNYATGVTYKLGQLVTYNSYTYQSLRDDNLGHEPDLVSGNPHNPGTSNASAAWWTLLTNGTTPPGLPQPAGTASHPKYTCSLVVRQQRTAADLMTGLLRGCNSHLGRNIATGQITLFARGSLAEQQAGVVAYRFDESSMARVAGNLTRPAVAGAGVPNIVTIPFNDEENDYSADSVSVTDADDINLMGQQISGSMALDGCNALDRANRLGSIYLAEQIDGDLWQWSSTAKAVRLLLGAIIAMTNAKHGFADQPMRVQQIAPAANYETVQIQASLHDDAWYADDFQGISGNGGGQTGLRNQLARPSWPWAPYQVQPPAGDPLYSITDWTFGLQLTYEVMADGTQQAVLTVTGKEPVNEPANLLPPVLVAQGDTASTGGTVPGAAVAGVSKVYFIAVASRDVNGRPGPVSKPCQVAVAQTGNTNTITAPVTFWDPAGSGYFLFVGRTANRLVAVNDAGFSGAPAWVDVLAIPDATWAPPDTEFDTLTARVSVLEHEGVFGIAIQGVVGVRSIQIPGAGFGVNDYAGYDCCVLAKADLSPVGVLNFRVASNTADTLTIDGASPDPLALGVAVGDVLVMLSLPVVAGLRITDARWMNPLENGGLGLGLHEEKGRILRFFAGTGRGYRYKIADNDATSITIAGSWIAGVTPDSTSRYVIEDAANLPDEVTSTPISNADQTAVIGMSVPVRNYAGKSLCIEMVTMDGAGNESAPQLNPVRMIYVPGAQGTAGYMQGYAPLVAVAGHAAPDLALGLNQELLLIADTIIDAPTNAPGPGTTWTLLVQWDATGGWALSFDPAFYVDGAALGQKFAPTPSTRSTIKFIHRADGKEEWDGTFKTGGPIA